MQESKIVVIPAKMERYYGRGKMLHPSIEELEDLVREIPKGKVATIAAIGDRLANDHAVDVTCPMRIGNAIKNIAKRYSIETIDYSLPFWRVLRTDNLMVKMQNFEYWASKLEDEGFVLDYTIKGEIKVVVNQNQVFTF